MALVQIFPLITIDEPMVSPAYKWPVGVSALYFQLDDTQFTDPADSFEFRIECSWDNGVVWKQTMFFTWRGGEPRSRAGGVPYYGTMGPFTRNGVDNPPQRIRFRAIPVTGTPRVGLFAEDVSAV